MTTIQHRRGTATQWASANPVLESGEIGIETDTNTFRIGNGTDPYLSLERFITEVDMNEVINAVLASGGGGGGGGGGTAPDATTTIKGLIQIADLSAMSDGTSSVLAATPAGVRQERLALKAEILGGAGAAYDTLQELYSLIGAAEETAAIDALITTVGNKADKPPAGVTIVMQFVYTNPAVARPSVPTYVNLNWVGPAGAGGAAPTNMATGDTWDMEV